MKRIIDLKKTGLNPITGSYNFLKSSGDRVTRLLEKKKQKKSKKLKGVKG